MRITLFVSIIFPFYCLAQSNDYFAPIGAAWHYSWAYGNSNGYIHIVSVKDTLIGNKSCNILTIKRFTYDFLTNTYDTSFLGYEYVYEDSGRVFYYRYNKFYKLYDFNAKPGDSWEIAGDFSFGNEGPIDSVGYTQVDSIGKLFINNDSLRYMYVSSPTTSKWFFGISADVCYWPSIMIIEKIGCLSFMFPRPVCIPSDYSNTGQLRCYFDSLFGNFSTNIIQECDYLFVGIKKSNEISFDIKIFPTIIRENITIYINEPKNHHIFFGIVYDLYGNIRLKTFLNNFENNIFSLKTLDAGPYFLKIKNNNINQSFLILKIN